MCYTQLCCYAYSSGDLWGALMMCVYLHVFFSKNKYKEKYLTVNKDNDYKSKETRVVTYLQIPYDSKHWCKKYW